MLARVMGFFTSLIHKYCLGNICTIIQVSGDQSGTFSGNGFTPAGNAQEWDSFFFF